MHRPENHVLQNLWCSPSKIQDLYAWETNQDVQGGLLAYTYRKNLASWYYLSTLRLVGSEYPADPAEYQDPERYEGGRS